MGRLAARPAPNTRGPCCLPSVAGYGITRAGRWDEPTRHPHRAQVATLTKTESVYETVGLRLGTPADHSGQAAI
jgi:hypothetical protein